MFTVRVPATSANLGPGFDTLGLALDLFLEVKVEQSKNGTVLVFNGIDRELMDSNTENNLIIKAMDSVFEKAGVLLPSLQISVSNSIPLGKGLGSSAAAITAGMFAANLLLEERFSRRDLIKWAVAMEGHADNIIPAVTGGFTASMLCEGEVYYQKMTFPENLKAVVAVPDFSLSTEKSRSVLPEKIDLNTMVGNLQRACFLVASLINNDTQNLQQAMDDMIYQPFRKQFIPGYDELVLAARQSGALGVAISGAGPSVIAFCGEKENNIGDAMQRTFASNGVDAQILFLKVNTEGVSWY